MAVLGVSATFRDVREWYMRLALLEQQVCLIQHSSGQPLGTGFLVGPNLVLTAGHVILAVDSLRFEPKGHIQARFDYIASLKPNALDESFKVSASLADWNLGVSGPYDANKPRKDRFDIGLFRLDEAVGHSPAPRGVGGIRGWIELSEETKIPPNGAGIAILQHPQGGPLKLAIETNALHGIDGETGSLLYRVDTMPGSSGAPVFDIDWNFVAIHEGNAYSRGNFNMGVPYAVVKEWLLERELWELASTPSPVSVPELVHSPNWAQGLPLEDTLKRMIKRGENAVLEFKRGYFTNENKTRDSDMESKILVSVAAFMNSKDGGTLLLGVEDDGKIVGVDCEFEKADPQRKNWDGYERFLTSKLSDLLECSAPMANFSVIRCVDDDGRTVCVIKVSPARSPVFVKRGRDPSFHVRRGSQNRKLTGAQMDVYFRDRFYER